MLQAILHGKAGRIASVTEDRLSWRSVFKSREDLLTAAFFGRFPYLSPCAQTGLVSLLTGKESSHGEFGEFLEGLFWARFDGVEGRSYIEPDVVLIWEKLVIVVEVKPPNGGAQSSAQWRREIEGLFLNLDELNIDIEQLESIEFVALGRNAPIWRAQAEKIKNSFEEDLLRINALEWKDVRRYLDENKSSQVGADWFVFRDWQEALKLFGIHPPLLEFSDLLQGKVFLDLSDCENNIERFELPTQRGCMCQAADWDALFEFVRKKPIKESSIKGLSWHLTKKKLDL